ncbi:MAG: FAD synthetase family protein [Spirochaetaceae bacterium]|nr:FAD synthetase family protein [Spirochaetaceae bacterium]
MHVLSWEDFLAGKPVPTAMTIGVFDAVHRGHRALIEATVRTGYNPTILTFSQNPKQMFRPRDFPGMLCSISRRLMLFEQLGVMQTVMIDFSGNFSTLKGLEFIDYLIGRGLSFLAIGKGFRCGYHLDTDDRAIAAYTGSRGIHTEIVSPVMDENKPISSSRIRTLIRHGDLVGAARLLGREPEIDLEGSSAYPSENGIWFNAADRVLPPDGVYRLAVYRNGQLEPAELRIAGAKIWKSVAD